MTGRVRLTALVFVAGIVLVAATRLGAAPPAVGPYDRQVAENIGRLADKSAGVRAAAAEALGFLRADAAEAALLARLGDSSLEVRRQAVTALAWCGSRRAVPPLLDSLDDRDWFVRQAAHVTLTNLTGQEFPFNGHAAAELRAAQVQAWRTWWATVPADRPPKEVLELLAGRRHATQGRSVTASTTYKGPPDVLVDGQIGREYWQTKNVPFPQWCTLDLGRATDVSQVTVYQYASGYCMTEYELAASLDGKTFDVVKRAKGVTPPELVIDFPARKTRYLRVTSYGSERPLYPTTFFEIEINQALSASPARAPTEWRVERGLRALGALGGRGATAAVLETLGETPPNAAPQRPLVRVGLRALGRLREAAGFAYLVELLDNTMWARYAADALGDFGDRRAVPALLAAYSRYARQLTGENPPDVPADDRMGFPSEDRMLETPYFIAHALCRLPLDDPQAVATLRGLAPRVMANLPTDHDTFMLYQPEVGHLLTRHLLDRCGMRQEACEHAMLRLGQPRRVPAPSDAGVWSAYSPQRISAWLPAVCTEADDLPRLVALLQHSNNWVRINAAKALAFRGDRRAVAPLARLLAEAKTEADFGYGSRFKDEEYNDPPPRWREALVRALGLLGAHEHTPLLVRTLNDQDAVLEVRRAAADALADLGNDDALAALKTAALEHDFFSIRHVARDALLARGIAVVEPEQKGAGVVFGQTGNDMGKRMNENDSRPPRGLAHNGLGNPSSRVTVISRSADVSRGSHVGASLRDSNPVSERPDHVAAAATTTGLSGVKAIVFIQGDNDVPNTPQTVEQADRWRQTYVVTDEGPTYRPGDNLFVLRPPRPGGTVTPLTRFTDGYVAEPEVSWDGRQVVFCRRGQEHPWWQVFRINVNGTGLTQLTNGPYHSIGPAWLPDGQIVFASSRVGTRDEYHGYLCTALCVMNADGSGLRPIATNIGRDNEPAVLDDGRIVFSRLEVFYSRNKTELTLHAAHPDGTQDVVLYGPERRAFWRNLKHGAPDPADGQEAPLTHRVLRMTQAQPMPDGRHIIAATQGGLTLIGPRRDSETLLCPDYQEYAYTTPFPLPDGKVLCAVTYRTPDRKKVDLGLYLFDPATGRRELVYNDPARADYEPRPIVARRPPPTALVESAPQGYSGRFFCSSVFETQEPDVRLRGRWVRLVEGVPMVGRHSTHRSPTPVWQNHGGTFARVLGTAPLAADGSFYAEVPADRLLHLQVLDSDRRVVGNQLTWIYPRPGETKSCVGCHERPHLAARRADSLAAHHPPLSFLPTGREFTYRAKAWFKGSLPPEIEERTRTVHAVNLLAR